MVSFRSSRMNYAVEDVTTDRNDSTIIEVTESDPDMKKHVGRGFIVSQSTLSAAMRYGV
ncbi:hypothetical protein WAI453_009047 [Rhynchosporium graminicola]